MTTKQKPTRVTVLGLGQMGVAVADALLDAGHQITVWNRTAERADDLVSRGARRADSALEAIADSPLVLITLADFDSVRAVLGEDPHHLRGRTLINLTTGTPDQARVLAEWIAGTDARYIDGAMLAVPQSVGTPDALFLYSGSEAGFAEHRELLDQLASSHFLGVDPGVAELWDLALLGSGYAALTGFLHSLAMLDTVQVPATQALPLVTLWLNGILGFMSELAKEIESGDYQEGVSPVGMNRAALASLVAVSTAQGVSPEVHSPLRALLDRRVADGHAADSFASLFELLRATPR